MPGETCPRSCAGLQHTDTVAVHQITKFRLRIQRRESERLTLNTICTASLSEPNLLCGLAHQALSGRMLHGSAGMRGPLCVLYRARAYIDVRLSQCRVHRCAIRTSAARRAEAKEEQEPKKRGALGGQLGPTCPYLWMPSLSMLATDFRAVQSSYTHIFNSQRISSEFLDMHALSLEKSCQLEDWALGSCWAPDHMGLWPCLMIGPCDGPCQRAATARRIIMPA